MAQGNQRKLEGKPRDLIAPHLFRAKKPLEPRTFRRLVRNRSGLPPQLLSKAEIAEWAAIADVPMGQLTPEQRARAEGLGSRARKLTLEQSQALYLEGKAARYLMVCDLVGGQRLFIDRYSSDDERFTCSFDIAIDNSDGKLASLKQWREKLAEAEKTGTRVPVPRMHRDLAVGMVRDIKGPACARRAKRAA